MLRKFISIKNVGRFEKCNATGDVELKRYNLIFAENGRGKTTLCAILRSLQSSNSGHILGRATLGSSNPPEIEVRTAYGVATFRLGAWSNSVPEIAIFDSTFVSENVHSGEVVSIDHRRSLYTVIVGKHGVDLAHKIEAFDGKSRAKAAEISEKTLAVAVFAPRGMAVDSFIGLPDEPAIADQIAAKERELDAVKQAAQIKDRSGLARLSLPAFNRAGVETTLAKTIEGVAADAERLVGEQVRSHSMHERGQAWVSEGLGYIQGNTCPFCNQSLEGAVSLIEAYKDFFSREYNSLRTEIAELRRHVETILSDRAIAEFEKVLDQNARTVEFWTRFCEIVAPALEEGSPGEILRSVRQAAVAFLDRKAAAPLERVDADASFAHVNDALVRLQNAVAAYNEAATAANIIISAKKRTTGAADVRSVEASLTRLRAIKVRHEPDARRACDELTLAQLEKRAIEDNKAAVRKELDEHTETVITRYEETINRLLDDFNAGFRIIGTKHGYPGGVASSTYQILINNTPVDLGDADTPLDQPSFRNTLSAGDRSTLALAFFLAQLHHDPDKAGKIVIFDDPFNSQDSFRKDCTVQKIRKCGEECTQLVVLSHDQRFLKRIWDRLQGAHSAECKCLEMARIGQRNTTICNWDIERATQDSYRVDRNALTDYFQARDGEPRDVVQKIRPVLETYCRNLGAGAVTQTDTLGVIVGKIRAAGHGHQLFPLCDGLDEVNEYTKRYMHGENANAATEPISDGELQGYVRRTLEMTGGC